MLKSLVQLNSPGTGSTSHSWGRYGAWGFEKLDPVALPELLLHELLQTGRMLGKRLFLVERRGYQRPHPTAEGLLALLPREDMF